MYMSYLVNVYYSDNLTEFQLKTENFWQIIYTTLAFWVPENANFWGKKLVLEYAKLFKNAIEKHLIT